MTKDPTKDSPKNSPEGKNLLKRWKKRLWFKRIPGAKRKKSIPRKSTRKRQRMEEDAEKEELKGFLDIIPKEEPYEDVNLEDQHEYNLLSWRLCDFCGIHILLMDNGLAIHMLTEKKYPLSQEMLSRKLEVDHESSQAFELLSVPPSKTTKQLEEIHNYKQEGDETLYQAWKRYRVSPPGYYTRVDNRPPFSEKKPSIEELRNKHLEESTRRRTKMEDWMKKLQETTYMNTKNQKSSLKNLETQTEQLAKDCQGKAVNEVPNSSMPVQGNISKGMKHREDETFFLMELTNFT
ncbi:hypothetical protein Tco_0098611 [Tanacetum coccineum]